MSVLMPEAPSGTLTADSVHVNPEPGGTETASATVPVNPFRPVRLTVAGPAIPAFTVTKLGLDVMLKS